MRQIALVVGLFLAASCTRPTAPVAAQATPEQEPSLRETLAQMVANGQALREVSFATVIDGTTGTEVIPVNAQDPIAKTMIDAVATAVAASIEDLNVEGSPIRSLRRINEASRFFEAQILIHLNRHPEISCTPPPTANGGTQRSGYPDLKLVHRPSGRIAYLDPKLFEMGSRNSTFRSFYYEPKTDTNKVLDDAHHLLVGIEHDGADGAWQFTNWHLVDLSKLTVRLKPEFQASNRDVYADDSILSSGR